MPHFKHWLHWFVSPRNSSESGVQGQCLIGEEAEAGGGEGEGASAGQERGRCTLHTSAWSCRVPRETGKAPLGLRGRAEPLRCLPHWPGQDLAFPRWHLSRATAELKSRSCSQRSVGVGHACRGTSNTWSHRGLPLGVGTQLSSPAGWPSRARLWNGEGQGHVVAQQSTPCICFVYCQPVTANHECPCFLKSILAWSLNYGSESTTITQRPKAKKESVLARPGPNSVPGGGWGCCGRLGVLIQS